MGLVSFCHSLDLFVVTLQVARRYLGISACTPCILLQLPAYATNVGEGQNMHAPTTTCMRNECGGGSQYACYHNHLL